MKKTILIICLIFGLFGSILAQSEEIQTQKLSDIEELKKNAPKVFVDCSRYNINILDYITTEITFVNHVRDRQGADVHVLVTTQKTASGGTEYTMAFIGQGGFEKVQDTLKYFSNKTDTEDDIRQGIVKVLKIGLIPYVVKNPISDHISISFTDGVKPTSVVDKWNFWVFSTSVRGFLNGEKNRDSTSVSGSFAANKTTPELKIATLLSASFDESNFIIDDEKNHSFSDSKSFNGLIAKSIGEHWSAGGYLSLGSSTYGNTKLSISPAAAIEYNLFPYSQSTRKQLRFLYKAGYNLFDYFEETIYDKTSESLFNESLSATLELKEPWGSISTSLQGSHYFPDFTKNKLRITSEISLRVLGGLSLNLNGNYSIVHDQLSLSKSGATEEEILLHRKELATTYNYRLSIGLSYTFGSIFSNVVNPRFGAGVEGYEHNQ